VCHSSRGTQGAFRRSASTLFESRPRKRSAGTAMIAPRKARTRASARRRPSVPPRRA
jgi:hypothetical protein